MIKAQPKLRREKGTDQAPATLAAALSALYDRQGAAAEMDGALMDELGEIGCPDAVAQALKSAGITSFTAL